MARMTMRQFVDRWHGRICDWDGYYGGQCTDLMREWIDNIGGRQLPGLSDGARHGYDRADPKYWRKVRNTPSGVPPEGAIVFFANSKLGHVSIARDGCTTSKLYTFDQNWPKGTPCTFVLHSYSRDKVIGWIIKR